MGCLCGCGGGDLHCLRPDRPPSPNTFYENFWAPNFAYMLQTRLEEAARNLEPSKRIWWREEFGGCAPDREPWDSEIWAYKGDDWGNVLRTSPAPFEYDLYVSRNRNQNRVQQSRKRQRSTSPLNTPISSPDESAKTPPQGFTDGRDHGSKGVHLYKDAEYWNKEYSGYSPNLTSFRPPFTRTPTPPQRLKSPTHYISDRFPPLRITEFSQGCPHHARRELRKEEEPSLLRQKLETLRLRRDDRLSVNMDRCKDVAGGSPTSKVDVPPVCEVGEMSAKGFANDWTHTDGSTRSLFQAPTVRLKAKSPKSPTHYIPEKLPPLQIPDFSRGYPLHHKRKELTAEEDAELLQAALRKVEANKIEIRRLLYGTPFERRKELPAESPDAISQGDQVENVLSNIQVKEMEPTAEDPQRLERSLYQKIKAMRLRRNHRHGIAIHRSEDPAYKSSPSTSPVGYSAGTSSMTLPISIV